MKKMQMPNLAGHLNLPSQKNGADRNRFNIHPTISKKEGKATGLIQDRIPGYNLAQLAAYPMVNPLWTKDTARSTASKLVFNYMGAKGDGILNIGEESTLFTNIAIPTDWNQTQMQKVGNYQLKVTAQAIQSKGFATQSEAYRMLDEEIKGGTLQEINRGSEN